MIGSDLEQPPATLSDDAANRVVRRLLDCRRYEQQVEAWAQHEIRLVKAKESWTLERYEPLLVRYTEQKLRGSLLRKRSVALPAGRIGFRSSPAKVVVADELALFARCCETLPAAVEVTVTAVGEDAVRLARRLEGLPGVQVKRHVRLTNLRDYAKTTGDLLPGAAWQPATERLLIQPV